MKEGPADPATKAKACKAHITAGAPPLAGRIAVNMSASIVDGKTPYRASLKDGFITWYRLYISEFNTCMVRPPLSLCRQPKAKANAPRFPASRASLVLAITSADKLF
jgi:hypothetical protein